MQVTADFEGSAGDGRRSVTNRARRDQIVTATIAVVAEEGYRASTFKRIAERAGLPSTRTISYHFASKDELMTSVQDRLFSVIGDFVAKRVTDHPDARAALAGYIRTAVALNDTHRTQMRALGRIFLDHRPADGARAYDDGQEHAALARVEAILRDGQQAGLFRAFDTAVMATTLQRSLDGIAFMLEHSPDLDLDHYAAELVTTFDLATTA